MEANENHTRITLTKDEALVLFEFLSRFSDQDELTAQDSSESRVLWDMLSRLEKKLTEPFDADYLDQLEKARASLRDDSSR